MHDARRATRTRFTFLGLKAANTSREAQTYYLRAYELRMRRTCSCDILLVT
jgi:hypothetical protein